MCELPDYQSKNGHIYAVSKNGTEVPLKIKGINWFGMETYVSLHMNRALFVSSHSASTLTLLSCA